jgi:hypothetical protein
MPQGRSSNGRISGTSKPGTEASSVLCAWRRKAVLAGGFFYFCLFSAKTQSHCLLKT